MFKRFFPLTLILCSALNAEPKVLAFAGSTRSDSYNKKLIAEAAAMASSLGAAVTLIDLKDFPMPFYDADLERDEGMPSEAKRLRELFKQNDVILISTPQYNASIPAVLKNALDWLSRDENGNASKEAFKGKTFALMSASPGKKGAAKALHHLVAIIKDCGGTVLDTTFSLPSAHEALTPHLPPLPHADLLAEIEIALFG